MNKKSTFLLLLSVALRPLSLPAADQYWDPDGTVLGSGISGNWDTVTTNWSTAVDAGGNAVWAQGNNANFNVASNYTVTATEAITVRNITVSGTAGTLTIDRTSANSLTLAASSTLNSGGRNVTISAPINGSFDLTRSGAGTVTLSGASTYSGGTSLTTGTIALGVDSVFSGPGITSGPLGTGPVTNNASTTIQASGGARILDNPITLNANLTVAGSTTLTFRNGNFMLNGGNRTLTVNDTADVTIQGNLADDGTPLRLFTKAGTAGRLILSGNNSGYLGSITINASGTLAAGSATAIQFNQPNSVVTANGTLDLNGFDAKVVGLAGSGAVVLGTKTLTIAAATTSRNFTGVISGTGGLVISNSVSQQLQGLNTFSGGILIKAGTLYLRTNATLGDNIVKAAGTGTITMEGSPDTVVANVTAALGGNASTDVVIITNRIVLASGKSLFFASNGGTVQFDSIMSGPGGWVRSDSGSGPIVLTGDNTFSGGLRIESRVLALGHKNALGTGTFTIGNPTSAPPNLIIIAATADLSGASSITNATTINQDFVIFDATTGANNLELSGPVSLSVGAKTITTFGTALVKISGVISGSGGISKAGANPLTFSANNSYTGSTIVSEGTLALTGSGSVAGSSNITLLFGATLDASGRTDGTLTVGAAQTLGGLGTIIGSATGGLNLSGGGTDRWELSALNTNPGYFNQLNLSGGNLVLGGTSKLSVNFVGTASSPHGGDPFWSSAHSWTALTLSGGASNPGNSDFTSVVNGVYTNGYFTTSVSASDVSLNFTPGAPPPPQLGSVVGAGTTSVTINFTAAIKGATYQVQYKGDLNDPGWSVLGSVAGTGSTASIIDTTNPVPGQRFYRIVVL